MVAQPVARDHVLLSEIRKGMLVCDRYGEEMTGTIKRVCLDTAAIPGTMPGALRTPPVPTGFIEIGTGILFGKCYAPVEQVRSLHDDVVILTACKCNLPRT